MSAALRSILVVSILASAMCQAQDATQNDPAKKVFDAIASAVGSGAASSIVAYIPDGETARFELKGIPAADLKADKAKEKLDEWFKGGAKGGVWKIHSRVDSGNPQCILKRDSDGRTFTVTLKKVKEKYYLVSIKERG